MTDVSQPRSLRIAVVGVGRIGSTFAFHLARTGGHHVTAVARPGSPRLLQLQRDGGVIDAAGQRADMQVAESLDVQVDYDLVIVTLLAHQIDAVLPTLASSRARCIQFMFNTFEPERLRDAVGAERCAFGMPFVQATLDEQGKLIAVIGAGGQKSLMDQQRWVDLFVAAGLPATLQADMPLWLRCHTPMCVAFESVCAAAVRRGGGASWREASVIARGVGESFIVIRRLGYRLYPQSKALIAALPAPGLAAMLWVISRIPSFRDLLATGTDECRALVGVMETAAAAIDPPVRVALIQAMAPSV